MLSLACPAAVDTLLKAAASTHSQHERFIGVALRLGDVKGVAGAPGVSPALVCIAKFNRACRQKRDNLRVKCVSHTLVLNMFSPCSVHTYTHTHVCTLDTNFRLLQLIATVLLLGVCRERYMVEEKERLFLVCVALWRTIDLAVQAF
jgi:hypothetical protein